MKKSILLSANSSQGKFMGLVFSVVAALLSPGELKAQSNTSYNANSVPIGGSSNAAVGSGALGSTTGSSNAALGYRSLYSNTSGGYNTASGAYSLTNNTTSNYNAAFGYQALQGNTTANNNTAVGFRSMYINTTGADNTAFGFAALYTNSTGSQNAAYGYEALYSNTASRNVAVGTKALRSNTTGWDNTAEGYQALYSNTTGAYNVATGGLALYSIVAGNRSCAYGYQALTASTGGNNAAIGFRALYNNTTGEQNTACGLGALLSNTTGSDNTAIGTWADVSTGNLSNATAIGYTAAVNASNKVRIGNTNITVIEGQVPFSNTSDGRFKTNIKEEDVKGLEFIKKLRPVVYNFDTKKFTEFLTKNMPEDERKQFMNQDFTASTNIRQSGFIAQEVEKAAKDVNYNFNGVNVPENENENYSLAYSQFVVPLVKGMQEQQKMIEDQKEMLNDQKKMIELLQVQVENLQKGSVKGSLENFGGNAYMEQNAPNPFTHETVIRFNLPAQVRNASLMIYDLSGKEVKSLPISERGAASVTITSEQLQAGMYVYSIMIDGQVLDAKRMVVLAK